MNAGYAQQVARETHFVGEGTRSVVISIA